jgi:hypothetical protein
VYVCGLEHATKDAASSAHRYEAPAVALEKTKVALVDVVEFAGPLVISGVAGGVGFAALAEPTPTATSAITRSPGLIYRNTPFADARDELCR